MLKTFLSELPHNYNVIIANGEFPASQAQQICNPMNQCCNPHESVDPSYKIHNSISDTMLTLIKNARNIISCDGATKHLVKYNIDPTIIIGDCDSLSEDIIIKFQDKIIKAPDQNNNDLSKAINWAKTKNLDNIVIIGATGLREDHTIANIGLMVEYAPQFKNIYMLSSYGIFTAYRGKASIKTVPGQQISCFATQNNTQVSASELKWPLKNYILKSWHCGTLNEATAMNLNIESTDYIIIYRSFEIKKTQSLANFTI